MLGFLCNKKAGSAPAPSINRRSLLLGLAAASTAAATAAAASTAKPAENPELLRLGDDTPALTAAYHRAVRAHGLARRWGLRHWPAVPVALLYDKGDRLHDSWASPASDFFGQRTGQYYWSVTALEWRATRAKSALRSKARVRPWHAFRTREEWQSELHHASSLIPVALAYSAAKARVSARADAIGTYAGHSEASQALAAHVTSIMAEPEVGMAGLLVKAEALAAWGTVLAGHRVLNSMNHNWHADIAAAILRHGKGGEATP